MTGEVTSSLVSEEAEQMNIREKTVRSFIITSQVIICKYKSSSKI